MTTERKDWTAGEEPKAPQHHEAPLTHKPDLIARITDTVSGILEQMGAAVEDEHIPPSDYYVAGGR